MRSPDFQVRLARTGRGCALLRHACVPAAELSRPWPDSVPVRLVIACCAAFCGILSAMPELISGPSRVAAAGTPPKLIDEYVGRANTSESELSIAHMRSPAGWAEPGQRPEFDEFTIVLHGTLVVESGAGQLTVCAGQGVHTRPGEWVRYSTPEEGGAEYISVCLPAFSPGTVNRDS